MSASDDLFTASVVLRDDIAILSIGGGIDFASAWTFEAVVANVLAGNVAGLIIDLAGVTFMASAGLRVLVLASIHGWTLWRDLLIFDLDPAGTGVVIPLVCPAFPVGLRSSGRVFVVKQWIVGRWCCATVQATLVPRASGWAGAGSVCVAGVPGAREC